MKKPSFKVGDKVFAKVKGYPPWPAKIIAENGKKYNVEFYGTGETGVIKIEDLFYFKKNKQKFQRPLKRKDYLDAFDQIEEAIAEDGGDGDETPNVNDSTSDMSSVSLNSSTVSLNTSVKEKKGVKRERTASTKSEATPVKKSSRLTRSEEAKSEDVVTEEKEPSVTPAKKSPKSRVKKDKEIKVDESSNVETNESVPEELDQKPDNGNEENEPVKQETGKNVLENSAPVDVKIEIVSDQHLKYNISYGKHVKEMKSIYKERSVEPREDYIRQVLPVQLPSGIMGGIKLHADWPLKFDNEYDRAVYDESVAQNALEAKVKILSGDTSLTSDAEKFVSDIGLSAEEIKQQSLAKDVKLRTARVARLKQEAELVSLDGKIKNCLGLDKADPKEAIGYLEEMNAIDFDDVMLKKHLHIVEMVRRLRKYVGNTKEWKMTDDSLTEFSSQAEKVRSKAEDVYAKFKKVVKLPENSTSFFEGFTELVSQFRATCKEMDMSETEIFVLCAEPRSRQAFMDRLDEKETQEISTEEEAPINGAEELPAGRS
ncbi:unnamed protein product [Phaedon cochleariae]|uniref:PWWP domain-containing protein n=1 Tax=Phaedon cochleariae TaxID=80249 RepID=A0A9P0DC61_PHACE|nr:unnamed protein product [Phaedon cochleariae]